MEWSENVLNSFNDLNITGILVDCQVNGLHLFYSITVMNERNNELIVYD